MKAKKVYENLETFPSEKEMKEIFTEEVNSVIYLRIEDDGTVVYGTYPGSSLRKRIKELFKSRGWDKYYDLKGMEVDDHEYTIPRFKSEVDRITPTFDPDADLPEGVDYEEQFIEAFVEQALDDPEAWLGLEQEYLEEARDDGELVFVVEERIDNFFPLFQGEFLDDVYQERHDGIIQQIAEGIENML